MPRRRRVVTGDEPVSRQEFDALKDQVRRVMAKAQMGLGVSPVLSGDPDVDDSYLYDWDGNVSSADQAENSTTVGGFTPDEIPYITDGSAPASSPTPTVQGGPLYFAVKWTAVANADLVTYEVHVSTSSGFTPSGSTLAGETPGTLAYLRKLPAGTDFAYDTDYYFKIVARDEDGSAAASAEAGPTQLNPNGTADILAGAITAEKLETVVALASSLMAGTPGGARVEVGYGVDANGNLDTGFIGVRAYDGDPLSTEPVFKLDAGGGSALFRGRVKFGAKSLSKLTTNDMVQLTEQPGGSWMVPALEQSSSATAEDVTSITGVFDAATTAGNFLIAVVTNWDATGNGVSSAPAGWASLKNNAFDSSAGRQAIYGIASTGETEVAVTFDKTVDQATIQVFEFSGVQDVQDAASSTATGSGSPATCGTTGTVTQDGMIFGAVVYQGNYNTLGVLPELTSEPSGYTQIGLIVDQDVVARLSLGNAVWMKLASGSTHTLSVNTEDVDAWRGALVSLKAKAVAVESAEANSSRFYAKDVDALSLMHAVDESGNQRVVALGKQGERWDFEVVNVTVNINAGASLGAHAGTSDTKTGITEVLSGDKICLMGTTSGSNYMRFMVDPTAAADGQVIFRSFNADSVSRTPGNITFDLLVIHRSV